MYIRVYCPKPSQSLPVLTTSRSAPPPQHNVPKNTKGCLIRDSTHAMCCCFPVFQSLPRLRCPWSRAVRAYFVRHVDPFFKFGGTASHAAPRARRQSVSAREPAGCRRPRRTRCGGRVPAGCTDTCALCTVSHTHCHPLYECTSTRLLCCITHLLFRICHMSVNH